MHTKAGKNKNAESRYKKKYEPIYLFSRSRVASTDIVEKFINSLMKGGNQQKAEKILSQVAMYVKRKQGKKSLLFIDKAVRNVRPLTELTQSTGSRSRRKPKAVPVFPNRGEKMAIQ